jgi:fumarylpyruvate hydrolase
MNHAIPSVSQVTVAIEGSEDRFPVRRIYCVGRNYRAHATDAVVENGATILYPPQTNNFHHEIELVVAIGKGGKNINKKDALDHVWGYGVGIDLTRRDIQNNAKENGRPWDMGKGFDKSAPCSALRPVSDVGHPDTGKGAIWIKVNGQIKQESTLDLHIWNTAETINYLSGLCELQPGDLIYMGTPDGVGAVVSGDTMEGHIDEVGDLTIKIA